MKSKPKPKAAAPQIREIVSFDYAMKNILRDKANSCILAGSLIAEWVKVEPIIHKKEGCMDKRWLR